MKIKIYTRIAAEGKMNLTNRPHMKFNKDSAVWLGLILAGIMLFFVIGERGYVLTNDSLGYMTASYEREPLYPLLIRLFRSVFGEKVYLQALVRIQSAAALSVCLYTAWFFRKRFGLTRPEWAFSAFLLMVPFFFDGMWSAPRENFSHYIATDALSYSLFYLFAVFLVTFLDTAGIRHYLKLALITMLMVLNRSQMQNCYVIMLIAAAIVLFRKRAGLKSVLLGMGGILLGTVAVTALLSYLYCYAMWGRLARSSENDFTMLSNLLYASDPEDVRLFEGEQAQAFRALYERIDEMGLTYRHADNAVIGNGMHLLRSHDTIKYEVIRPFFSDYIAQKGLEENFQGDQVKKKLASQLKEKLLKKHFFRWAWDGICMMPYGLLLAVTPVVSPRYMWFCAGYAMLFWILMLGLTAYAFHKNKCSECLDFAFCVIAFILINTASCAVIIFVNARYLNYTQGLIYFVLYLLLKTCMTPRREKGKRAYGAGG